MIYLVRHGETDWNIEGRTQGHTDISLNANGIKQAEDLAKSIKNIKINKIFSSDLLRAKETAEIIGKIINCDNIEFDSRLREINYGDLEGIPRNELLPSIWETFNNNSQSLNAEAIGDVFIRIKEFFDSFINAENVIIITHGGALRVIMYYIQNSNYFDNEEYRKKYKDLKIKNTAIFEWDISENIVLQFCNNL